jgi:hypothetical protein
VLLYQNRLPPIRPVRPGCRLVWGRVVNHGLSWHPYRHEVRHLYASTNHM